ncbi:hypothetical protein Cadr_000019351 [Camelus dromedarius]|uniref:Uncharacterized protein n=1 Tax=Camelus dromedarius TaxID=9838 RepID=A0A5N4D4J1_CAMDR|nr:hypothetical protein Cadr_000019351 [Camelus dromedarius]
MSKHPAPSPPMVPQTHLELTQADTSPRHHGTILFTGSRHPGWARHRGYADKAHHFPWGSQKEMPQEGRGIPGSAHVPDLLHALMTDREVTRIQYLELDGDTRVAALVAKNNGDRPEGFRGEAGDLGSTLRPHGDFRSPQAPTWEASQLLHPFHSWLTWKGEHVSIHSHLNRQGEGDHLGERSSSAESRRHPSALARAGVSPSPSAPPSGFPWSGHCDPPPDRPPALAQDTVKASRTDPTVAEPNSTCLAAVPLLGPPACAGVHKGQVRGTNRPLGRHHRRQGRTPCGFWGKITREADGEKHPTEEKSPSAKSSWLTAPLSSSLHPDQEARGPCAAARLCPPTQWGPAEGWPHSFLAEWPIPCDDLDGIQGRLGRWGTWLAGSDEGRGRATCLLWTQADGLTRPEKALKAAGLLVGLNKVGGHASHPCQEIQKSGLRGFNRAGVGGQKRWGRRGGQLPNPGMTDDGFPKGQGTLDLLPAASPSLPSLSLCLQPSWTISGVQGRNWDVSKEPRSFSPISWVPLWGLRERNISTGTTGQGFLCKRRKGQHPSDWTGRTLQTEIPHERGLGPTRRPGHTLWSPVLPGKQPQSQCFSSSGPAVLQRGRPVLPSWPTVPATSAWTSTSRTCAPGLQHSGGVRATLATKQASSTSSAEEPAPPRSGNDDPAKGLGRTVAVSAMLSSCVALFLLEPPVPCTPRNCRGLIRTAFSFTAQERPCSEWNWEEREAQSPTLRAASRAPRNSPQTLGSRLKCRVSVSASRDPDSGLGTRESAFDTLLLNAYLGLVLPAYTGQVEGEQHGRERGQSFATGSGGSEIIPLLVGQDPRGLTAKQNPTPCPGDTPHKEPVCWERSTRDEVTSWEVVLGGLLGGPSTESSYSGTRGPRSGERASFNKQSKRSLRREDWSSSDRVPRVSAHIAEEESPGTCKAARPTTYRRKEKGGEQRQNLIPWEGGRGGVAEARPGQTAGDPLFLQTEKRPSLLHSRLWQQNQLGREPGTKNLPQTPPRTVTDFCIKADQQVHCPSAPDHHLRAISAPCILFFKLWPEGTLGTRTSDVSSFPPTDKPLVCGWGLAKAVGLLSAQALAGGPVSCQNVTLVSGNTTRQDGEAGRMGKGFTTNRQRIRETAEDTLFLQNWAAVLKVEVTITSFPIVAAPPATGSAPQPFHRQVWRWAPGWRRGGGGGGGAAGIRMEGTGGDDRTGQRIRHPPEN